MFETELPFGFESEEAFIYKMQEIFPQYDISTFSDALEVYGKIQLGII